VFGLFGLEDRAAGVAGFKLLGWLVSGFELVVQPTRVAPIQNAEITAIALRIENPPSDKKIKTSLNGAKMATLNGGEACNPHA
jgi:hypothetical protein